MQVSPERIRRTAQRTRAVMRGVNLSRAFNAAANDATLVYENMPLPANAQNMFTLGSFKVGDKVMKYAPGKYIKVADFVRYLRSPRAGKLAFRNDFVNAAGNKKFNSPEGVRFTRASVKFYKFV